mmetsp:Transcript_8008/g.9993  ORF Transcript_8008/g.9993 Transcript_8008/m.9993 type:complete len:357 (-) Transcript_8008:1207-2277(-)
MYSNIDTDDVFSSAMEEAEIVENPFDNDEMTGLSEPLHAVDAARRLLGNDDIDSGNGHDMNMGGAGQPPAFAQPSNSSMGNSLLERIQQQKKQQNSTSAPSPAAPVAPATTNTTTDFGYPMVEEGNYSTPGTAATTATATSNDNNIRIPEYSQTPAPNAYNPDSAYNAHLNYQGGGAGAGASSTDYKGTAMAVLSAVGSAAGTVAMGAYQGTKFVYGKMAKINSSGVGSAGGSGGHMGMGMGGSGGGGNMNEMDYQRESLLMDPHDIEDRAAPMGGMGMGSSAAATDPLSNSMTSPSGMRAGILNANSINDTGSSFLNFVKSFAVDMKDLFLGASRRVQAGVVVLAVFIIWLIFFE